MAKKAKQAEVYSFSENTPPSPETNWEAIACENAEKIGELQAACDEKDDLIVQLQEANRLTQESLEQAQAQAAGNPPQSSFSPGEKLYLMAACIGALKDPQNLGPLDDANFQAQLPLFIDQAETLFTRLIERILNPTL